MATNSTTRPPVPYKFGSHIQNCNCGSRLNIIAATRKRSYVQALEAALLSERSTKAEGSPAVVASLEAQVLSLRELLDKSKSESERLHRCLGECRKISQEREAQLTTATNKLTSCQQTLKSTEDKLNIATVQLRHTQDENKAAKDLQDRTADDLGAALAQVEDLAKRCDLYKGQAERIGEANTKLITAKVQFDAEVKEMRGDLAAMTAERDGYAAELKVLTQEANAQRLAADDAQAEIIRLGAELASITGNREQEFREWDEERDRLQQSLEIAELHRTTAYWMIGVVTAAITGFIGWLAGRWTR